MASYRTRRIIPIALILIIIAIVIAVLVSVIRINFFSDNNGLNSSQDISRDALLDTSLGHAVRMTVRGPINADEDFKSYQITVTPDSRAITEYKGYLNQSIDHIALGNNVPAYEQFVYALDRANLVKGSEFTGDKNDLRGICATGRVYEFEVLQADKSIKTLWTSSCSNAKGSLAARIDQLTSLFASQIPNSRAFISKVF